MCRHSDAAIDPEGKCTPAAPAASATSKREFTRTFFARRIASRTTAINSRAGNSLSHLHPIHIASEIQSPVSYATSNHSGYWLLAAGYFFFVI